MTFPSKTNRTLTDNEKLEFSAVSMSERTEKIREKVTLAYLIYLLKFSSSFSSVRSF